MSKKCTVCGIEKDESEFYNGHGKCKECYKERMKERYKKDREQILKKKSAYYKTPEGKAAAKRGRQHYQHTEKGKEAAVRNNRKYRQTEKGKTCMKRDREHKKAKKLLLEDNLMMMVEGLQIPYNLTVLL